jgi:nucleotide-binding universal stress UspA family protein
MKKTNSPDLWLAGESVASLAARSRPVTRVPRPERGMRPLRPTRRPEPRLVLALPSAERPTPSLRRALALARSLDAELHVLRVLPGLTRLQALFSRNDVLSAARAVQRTLRANRITRSWLRVTLGSDEVIERLCIVHGDFVEQAAAYAAGVGAQMIILPPSPRRLGRTATSLARASRKPVLVAREHRGSSAILAATDLQTSGHPVLWKAAELGKRLRAKLVALHNVDPIGGAELLPGTLSAGAMTVGAGAWASIHQPAASSRARLEQLTRATAPLPLEAEPMVLTEADAARAILSQAGLLDPDCLVIGARQRNWLEELACGSVAREVIERARRSVLVVPMDAATAASTRAVSAPSPATPPPLA